MISKFCTTCQPRASFWCVHSA